MSDSERDLTPVSSAAGDDAVIESTENAETTQAQAHANEDQDNDLDQADGGAKGSADEDEDMDDLFGDGGDEDNAPTKKRRLDDEELDSGDDIDRDDRMVEDDQPETPQPMKENIEAEISLHRHASLRGSDGEVYLFQNAINNGIEPKMFVPASFKPPTTSHHSTEASTGFSAAQTAASTIRWRYNPNDSSKMQSNSRIIRWSDGSLTLQIGSNATEHYELAAKAFAPPQRHPKKPTPVSRVQKKGMQPNTSKKQEAHIYLASVDESLNIARITNHITANLNVRSTKGAGTDDTEILKLQERMAAATAAREGGAASGGMELTTSVEDPDLLRKRAEKAEKEKAKMEKSMAARREREISRRVGTMGRSAGMGRSGMGLSVAGLEDEGGGYGVSKKRGPPKKRTRRDEYTSDDDFDRQPGGRDEYDEGDDFIAPEDSEEEPAVADDDDDDDLLDDDAEGEDDDEAPPKKTAAKGDETSGRRKGRQVVEDDDDDE